MKQGDFSLQVIEAETREPMKEFTAPDGKVYVEAEPDLEYFLRCTSGHESRTEVHLDVDYTPVIAYYFSNSTGDLGLLKRESGVASFVALKFTLKRIQAVVDPTTRESQIPHVGKITATFHESIKCRGRRKVRDRDTTSLFDKSRESSATPVTTGKKAFASVAGSCTAVSERRACHYQHMRKTGRKLGQITVHYASALGFIQLGILTSPSEPSNNNAREDTSSSNVRPTTRANVSSEEPDRKRVKTESSTTTNTDNQVHLSADDRARNRAKPEPSVSSSTRSSNFMEHTSDEPVIIRVQTKSSMASNLHSENAVIDLTCMASNVKGDSAVIDLTCDSD
jgi:hypothetical protein